MLAIRHAFRGRSELCRRVTHADAYRTSYSIPDSFWTPNIRASSVSKSVPDTKKAPFRIARAVRVNTPRQRRIGRLEQQFVTRGKLLRIGHLRPPSTWEDIKDLTPAGAKLLADSHIHLNTARRLVEEVRRVRLSHASRSCMHALALPSFRLGRPSSCMPSRRAVYHGNDVEGFRPRPHCSLNSTARLLTGMYSYLLAFSRLVIHGLIGHALTTFVH